MRKFIKALIRKYPSCRFITIIFIIWRLNLELLNFLGRFILPEKNSFFGTIPWANFDGVHYLSIAKSGYFQYEQAFFPLYPLLIRFLAPLFGGNFVISGFIISNLSLLFSLFIFWKLIGLDELKLNSEKRKWVLIFFLFFPTAFFFGSLYTESLFLLLILGSFYFLYKKKIFCNFGLLVFSCSFSWRFSFSSRRAYRVYVLSCKRVCGSSYFYSRSTRFWRWTKRRRFDSFTAGLLSLPQDFFNRPLLFLRLFYCRFGIFYVPFITLSSVPCLEKENTGILAALFTGCSFRSYFNRKFVFNAQIYFSCFSNFYCFRFA